MSEVTTNLKINSYDYVDGNQTYEVLADRNGLDLIFFVKNKPKLVKDDNGFEQWVEVDVDSCEVKTYIVTEHADFIEISSFLSGYAVNDLLPYMVKEVLSYVANLVLTEYTQQQRMKYSPLNRD